MTVATLGLTFVLAYTVPKGFFPVQDTGVILGISEAPQSVSFEAMSGLQQQLAKNILQDPDVESLSSFIGIDGTNSTANSGRIQINLKPREQRKASAPEIIARLQEQAGGGIRHHPVPAAGAGFDGGRPRQPDAVPVHPGVSRRARTGAAGPATWWPS